MTEMDLPRRDYMIFRIGTAVLLESNFVNTNKFGMFPILITVTFITKYSSKKYLQMNNLPIRSKFVGFLTNLFETTCTPTIFVI